MSAVIAVPDMMVKAATDMARIGDTLNAAHMTAAVPTTQVLPAAADEVSAGIAHLMSGYGQEYQKVAGQAAASYEQFAQHLTTSAVSYASAEAANIDLLQPLTTIAGSIGSAIGALPGQLLNLVDGAVGQLLNDFLAFVSSQPALEKLFVFVFARSFIVLILSAIILVGLFAIFLGPFIQNIQI